MCGMRSFVVVLAGSLMACGQAAAAADDVAQTVILLDQWESCVKTFSEGFAERLDEPADVIAMGAYGSCERELLMYVHSVDKITGSKGTSESLDQIAKTRVQNSFYSTVAKILQFRARKKM